MYSDIHLFNIESREWKRISLKNSIARHSGSAVVYNQTLLVFGGVSDRGDYSNDVVVIDPCIVLILS